MECGWLPFFCSLPPPLPLRRTAVSGWSGWSVCVRGKEIDEKVESGSESHRSSLPLSLLLPPSLFSSLSLSHQVRLGDAVHHGRAGQQGSQGDGVGAAVHSQRRRARRRKRKKKVGARGQQRERHSTVSRPFFSSLRGRLPLARSSQCPSGGARRRRRRRSPTSPRPAGEGERGVGEGGESWPRPALHWAAQFPHAPSLPLPPFHCITQLRGPQPPGPGRHAHGGQRDLWVSVGGRRVGAERVGSRGERETPEKSFQPGPPLSHPLPPFTVTAPRPPPPWSASASPSAGPSKRWPPATGS